MANDNHPARTLLHEIICNTLGFQVDSITPLEYDEECPFPYNNFLFKVQLNSTPGSASIPSIPSVPGTSPLPPGQHEVVVRVSNPHADDVNQQNRVPNEVAAMTLVRGALRSVSLEHLIPEVYWWMSEDEGQRALMIMEYKPGVPLSTLLEDESFTNIEPILDQFATAFAAMQELGPLRTVQGYGGMSFDADGRIICDSMTTLPVLPQQSFANFICARIRAQIQDAQKHGLLVSKEGNALYKRIETLLNSDFIRTMDEDNTLVKAGLVQEDFSKLYFNNYADEQVLTSRQAASNILVDPQTLQLTALLDFDFTHIGSRLESFCSLLPLKQSGLPGSIAAKDDSQLGELRKCILTGSWDTMVTTADGQGGSWNLVRVLYAAFQRAKVILPHQLGRAADLSNVLELGQLLCPFLICNKVVASGRTGDQRRDDILNAESKIEQALANIDLD